MRRLRRELERRKSPAGRKVRAYAAIPEGFKKARSQGQWMNVVDRLLAENHDLGRIRADALDNTRSVAWVLCRYTDWRTMLARPGHHLLAELAGVSVTTVKRVIRRLRKWGLVGLASPGSTWRTRGSFDPRAAQVCGGLDAVCLRESRMRTRAVPVRGSWRWSSGPQTAAPPRPGENPPVRESWAVTVAWWGLCG